MDLPLQQTDVMLAETEPPKILPRILKRFDLVTIYFAIIFGSYGAAQMTSHGWAGIPMLLLATITFLIPCMLGAFELGTLFPSEGGIYVWTHKTFGAIHGFIAGWLSWVPIFLLVPLDASVIIAHLQYALGQEWSLFAQVAAQIVFVWVLFGVCTLRLRISLTVVNIMFFVAMGTAVTALIAGLMHVGGAATPITSDIYSFDLSKHGALFSAAVLWLLGAEVPFNMGAEFSEHKKTARTMFLWGTATLLVGYIIGIIGILLTTDASAVDATTGLARAVTTLSPIAGTIVSIGICFAVFAQATSTMNAYSRLLFIGGIEKRAPSVMGTVSEKNKSPWPALLVQAAVATVVILVFATQTTSAVTFNLYLAGLVAVWCASLFYIYLGLLRARKSLQSLYAERAATVWKIPGGRVGLWLTCTIGIVFNALAIYYVFAKPWVDGISVDGWRAWLGVTSCLIILIGVVVFYVSPKK